MAGDGAATNLAPREVTEADYGPYYFAHCLGLPYERNEHWLTFFGDIADHIVRELAPKRVLDAGCAKGFLVEALRKRGVEAYGVDISAHAIAEVDESVKEHCRVGSITEPLDQRYDLIISIEVLEHLSPPDSERAVANLCAATHRILLSSTPSDFGEATHLNMQPPEGWAAMFAREGFLRDVERDASYITPWAALFVRREEPFDESVRRYDRSWSRLKEETRALRSALLEAHERLAELEGTADPQTGVVEVTALKEELLRLRDLLISKDVELGTARGELAAARDQAERYQNVLRRMHPRLPGVLSAVARALRGLRGG